MDKESLQLIRDAKIGSPEAFTQLVRDYRDYVYRTVYGILQHHSDVQDIVQEVFIKIFLSIGQLHDERAFPTWLATIATRMTLDYIRKQERDKSTVLQEERFYEISQDSELHRADLRLSLLQALSTLPPEHRATLLLREIHGFDYQEIADTLGIPIGTVRSRLHAARMNMRHALRDEKSEGDFHGGL